jgi:septal ring factor EnvC (AmiA/AmiB activator)
MIQMAKSNSNENVGHDDDPFTLNDWGVPKATNDTTSSGLVTANKFLRTKLQLVQKDLDKVLADRAQKEKKLETMEESCKALEDDKKKLSKTIATLHAQTEKQKKLMDDLKRHESELETELLSMRKVGTSFLLNAWTTLSK